MPDVESIPIAGWVVAALMCLAGSAWALRVRNYRTALLTLILAALLTSFPLLISGSTQHDAHLRFSLVPSPSPS